MNKYIVIFSSNSWEYRTHVILTGYKMSVENVKSKVVEVDNVAIEFDEEIGSIFLVYDDKHENLYSSDRYNKEYSRDDNIDYLEDILAIRGGKW